MISYNFIFFEFFFDFVCAPKYFCLWLCPSKCASLCWCYVKKQYTWQMKLIKLEFILKHSTCR